MDMDRKTLIYAIEDAGYEADEYSGRGMYGRSCVSFTTDNIVEATARICEVFFVDYGEIETADVVELFSRARVDNMGLDMVVYFPEVGWDDDGGAPTDDDPSGSPSYAG